MHCENLKFTCSSRLLMMAHMQILVRTTHYGIHLNYELGLFPTNTGSPITAKDFT